MSKKPIVKAYAEGGPIGEHASHVHRWLLEKAIEKPPHEPWLARMRRGPVAIAQNPIVTGREAFLVARVTFLPAEAEAARYGPA